MTAPVKASALGLRAVFYLQRNWIPTEGLQDTAECLPWSPSRGTEDLENTPSAGSLQLAWADGERGSKGPPEKLPGWGNLHLAGGKGAGAEWGGGQSELGQPEVAMGHFLLFSFIAQEVTSQRPASPFFWFAFPVIRT